VIAIPDLALIVARLPLIFPETLEDRTYCVREMAAKTVFTMFYLDAVEGTGRLMRPSQVTVMSDAQAAKRGDADRLAFAHATLTRKKSERYMPAVDHWYKANTREPIRDETLGDGLIKYNAVTAIAVATTSDKPRYSMTKAFAELFLVPDTAFAAAADAWRQQHLSEDALRRIALLRQGVLLYDKAVVVNFPGGAGQFQLSPGESSILTKAFVEQFAPRYLIQPVVLFISESGNKAAGFLSDRTKTFGIVIDVKTLLPDVMLVDLGCTPMRLVFAEIVNTDGPIRETRKREFLALAAKAGIRAQDCSFVTVFSHRDSSPFKKAVNALAWGAYAWFMTEPNKLIDLSESTVPLAQRP